MKKYLSIFLSICLLASAGLFPEKVNAAEVAADYEAVETEEVELLEEESSEELSLSEDETEEIYLEEDAEVDSSGILIDDNAENQEELIEEDFSLQEDLPTSGKCGDHLTWKITKTADDCILTISGTGAMYDYQHPNYGETAPWSSYKDITKLVLEKGITVIGEYSFYRSSNWDLKEVVIPEGVTQIKDNASIYGYKATLSLPDSLEVIGKHVFGRFSEIRIPKNVKEIDPEFAYSRTEITKISVDESNPYYDCRENCNAIIDSRTNTLVYATNMTTFIPSSVEIIGDYAFNSCEQKNISIPNGVKRIGKRSFGGTKFETIRIPDSVQGIGEGAFSGSKIKSIAFPEGITTICDDTFYQCSQLQRVTLPSTLTNIGESSFSGAGITEISFPEGLESIGSCAFRDSKLQNVKLPESIISMDMTVFKGCSELKSITFPSTMSIIPGYTCADCTSLEEVHFLGKLEGIDCEAFRGCSSLKKISLPRTIGYIYMGAFQNCTSLEEFIFPHGCKKICSDSLSGCTALKEVSIPREVKYVDFRAFENDTQLTDIYYEGTEAEFKKISIPRDGNDPLLSQATIHYNSYKGEPLPAPGTYSIEIVFDPNGGSGDRMASVTVGYRYSVSVPNCSYTKDGCKFTSWNTEADGTGDKYVPGAEFYNDIEAGLCLTLYAQWEKVENGSLITYELNGGKNNPGNISVVQEKQKFKLLNPSRDGYNFKGWYKDSKLKKKITTITGKKGVDYTVYTKWEKAKYKIKYMNLQGGTVDKKNPKSYYITDDTKNLYPATRKGYRFAGWFTDEEFLHPIDKIESGSHGDLYLFAGWRPNEYTVKYDGNSADRGYTADTVHGYKAYGSLAECGYIKDGYHFTKWNKKAKGLGTSYSAGYSKNDFSNKEGDIITLYARWEPNKYTVKYDGNGATSGSTKSSTFTYDKKSKLANNGFKRYGYTFTGWLYDDGLANHFYQAGESRVFNLTTGTGTVTFKAVWVANPNEKIKVSNISFKTSEITTDVGQSIDLRNHIEIQPFDATNKKLKWSSNHSDIISVDKYGVATAKKGGEATITASTQDGSNLSASLNIFVRTYDIEATVKCARDNWDNNAYGDCAEFAARCLIAGGIPINVETSTTVLRDRLIRLGYFKEYKVVFDKNNGGKVYLKDNPGTLDVGDVLIYKVTGAGCVHTALVTATDGEIILAVQRNEAVPEEKGKWPASYNRWINGTHYSCLDGTIEMYVLHYTGR